MPALPGLSPASGKAIIVEIDAPCGRETPGEACDGSRASPYGERSIAELY
jgi:hypothetical protein